MKGIQFELQLKEQLSPTIFVDLKKIKQVLFIVLFNSLRHTTSGRILVRAQDKWNDLKKYLKISVIDTGCGLSDDLKVKLISFFAEKNMDHSPISYEFGFSSLIVKRIINLLQGTLKLSSM